MRLQLALNVPDIEAAVAYYSIAFGVTPHKRRPGYANFAIKVPPLKLVLFENPKAEAHLHHIGVETMGPGEVEAARKRFEEAGILDEVQERTECCHAIQEKIWSKAPNGLRWEWYRIIHDDPSGQDTQEETCGREDQTDEDSRVLGRLRARRWQQRLIQERLGQT